MVTYGNKSRFFYGFYCVLGAFLFLFLWVGLSIININKHKCVNK